jgi:hypothetical protein
VPLRQGKIVENSFKSAQKGTYSICSKLTE